VFAYLIILSSALAGLAQAHWWTAVAAGCLLGLLLFSEKVERFPNAPMQVRAIELSTASTSLAFGTAAACLAFVVGRSSAWLWGL
jgi:site-specific recombinase